MLSSIVAVRVNIRFSVQSWISSWFVQNLSSLFLNVLTLFALITEAGKLFHVFTILTENENFLRW